MERGSTAENSGDKAVMGNGPEKDAQKSKKGKDHRNDKKEKRNVCNGDGSIYSSSKKHGVVKELAEKSCLMSENPGLEGGTCNSDLKKDKEVGTVGKEQVIASGNEKVHAEGGMCNSDLKKGKKKMKKDKEVGTVGKEQVTTSSDEKEHAEGGMCNSNLKKDKKKKKKDKEVGTVGKEQVATSGDEKVGGMCNSDLKKGKKKMKKDNDVGTVGEEQVTTSSDEKEHAEGGMCNSNLKEDKKKKTKDKEVGTVGKEQVATSGDEKEHAKGGMCNSSLKKNKKKRKKDNDVGTVGKEQITISGDENLGFEHTERDKLAGGQVIKSKKGKRKHHEVGTSDGSCGDQIVSGEGKKKKRKNKHSVTLEEGKQVDISKMGEKGKGKKGIKESDNVAQDLKQYTLAGGKNGKKQKIKSKDDNEGGKRENEKVSQRKDKGRRVSFTDAVEVFGDDEGVGDDEEDDGTSVSNLVHGQRFTPEEDAKLMEAIMNYAEMKQLGEKGVEMIRSSIKHPELRGCWAEIATALPHRPAVAIYKRARILLYRSAERKWTEEEYEVVRRYVENNGTTWKKLAMDLGKSEIHVKDTWRRMKPKNLKKGPWTQDEYQNLFDLVNLDLRVKAHQKFDHGHRLIRENISWEAISEKLTTRSNKDCCLKWYQQLASSLVKQGIWADTDDYLLVEALQKVDAVCIEDVDWENLLDHRSGELCRERWNQMIRMLGGHREKTFIEQVEVLARRYCPEMLDYRKSEASDLSPETIAEDS